MWRTVFGVVAGLVAWIVIVSVLDRGLRLWVPGYVEAEPGLHFTLAMKIARLSMAAITSLAAGAIARSVAPASSAAPLVVGAILLVLFIPDHIYVWQKLPLWYHLTFLLTLVPLVVAGSWLVPQGKPAVA